MCSEDSNNINTTNNCHKLTTALLTNSPCLGFIRLSFFSRFSFHYLRTFYFLRLEFLSLPYVEVCLFIDFCDFLNTFNACLMTLISVLVRLVCMLDWSSSLPASAPNARIISYHITSSRFTWAVVETRQATIQTTSQTNIVTSRSNRCERSTDLASLGGPTNTPKTFFLILLRRPNQLYIIFIFSNLTVPLQGTSGLRCVNSDTLRLLRGSDEWF